MLLLTFTTHWIKNMVLWLSTFGTRAFSVRPKNSSHRFLLTLQLGLMSVRLVLDQNRTLDCFGVLKGQNFGYNKRRPSV